MKRTVYLSLSLAAALVLMTSAAMAAECSGSWRVLPHYVPGTGGVCAAIGLNTHQAVCRPGQRYATYCDDASGGRYRTCQSNIPCWGGRGYGGRDGYGGGYDRWDYRYDRRDDRRDWYDYRGDRYRDYRYRRGPDCTRWDFQANRPCPPGRINSDCRNDCASGW